jgi:hypothetical protein
MIYGDSKASQSRVYRGDGHHDGHVRDVVTNSNQTLPEVYRLLPDHVTPLSSGWVRLWKDLNPALDVEHFGTLLGNTVAWTNGTGWPGRKNVLLGENLDQADPAFDHPRLCGGALLKGAEWNGTLFIQSMLVSDPVPAADYVLDRPWLWYWGTQIAPSGNVTYIQRTGMDGRLHPVRIPLVTKLPVYLPIAWLDKLPLGFVPVDGRWMPDGNGR